MGVLFFLLFAASILCMLLGLIKPTLVLRWGKKRTRARAFGWYALFAFLCMLLGVRTVDLKKQGSPHQAEISSEQKHDEGKSKSELINLYCNFIERKNELRSEADRKFGVHAHNALKKGDIIKADQETALLIAPIGYINNENELHGKIKSISKISKGDKFVITRVIKDAHGFYWYEATNLKTSKHGYIRNAALFWYDTVDRSAKHEGKVSAWIEPQYTKLEKKIFTEKGLSRWDIEDVADKEKWRLQCNHGK